MRVAHGQFVIPFLLFITVVIPPSQAAAWDRSSVGIHYHEGNDHSEPPPFEKGNSYGLDSPVMTIYWTMSKRSIII